MDKISAFLDTHASYQSTFDFFSIKNYPQLAALTRLPAPVISVAGTNGKGSVIAYLEAMLLAAGFRVAAYTSPHLLNPTERLRINGKPIAEDDLLAALQAIQPLTLNERLSYFTYITLASYYLLQDIDVDYILLEVGLGARLDPVNWVDSAVSIITSIDLDHTHILGNTIDAIAKEKAAIMRAGKPCVYSATPVPDAIAAHANRVGAHLYTLGNEFHYRLQAQGYALEASALQYDVLPNVPFVSNLVAAIMALSLLPTPVILDAVTLHVAIDGAHNPARWQILQREPTIIIDVAHNVAACRALADYLNQDARETKAIVGMQGDKDIAGCLNPMLALIDAWYLYQLPPPRGASSERLASILAAENQSILMQTDKMSEIMAGLELGSTQRLVVFGSFVTVGAFLQHHKFCAYSDNSV